MKISGIYQIQSIIKPKRIYIGSAVNVKHRWNSHLSDLNKSKHHSIKLQRHFNKYGERDLIFIILELCFPEFLTAREQYYINKLKPYFNTSKIAGSQLGIKRSDEFKQKLREVSMRDGRKPPSRKGQIPWMKGKHHSAETKRKCSEAAKGRAPWCKGKHLSEKTKKKISQNSGSRRMEVRQKLRDAAKKRPLISEETRKRMSEAQKKRRSMSSSIRLKIA